MNYFEYFKNKLQKHIIRFIRVYYQPGYKHNETIDRNIFQKKKKYVQ